jgi:CheY-like chemotaxis protein
MNEAGERQRPLVLVADDDEHILSLVSLQLERASMDVVQARHGEEALTLAIEQRPDLAVLDVMMPDLNGYEVVKRLRGDDFSRGELRERVEALLGREREQGEWSAGPRRAAGGGGSAPWWRAACRRGSAGVARGRARGGRGSAGSRRARSRCG